MSKFEIREYEYQNKTRFHIIHPNTNLPIKLSRTFNTCIQASEYLDSLTKTLIDKNNNVHLTYADKLNADLKIDGKTVLTKDNYDQNLRDYRKKASNYLKENDIKHQNVLFTNRKQMDALYELYSDATKNIMIGAIPHSKYPSQYCDQYPKQVTFNSFINPVLTKHFRRNLESLLLNVQIDFYTYHKECKGFTDTEYSALMENLETIFDLAETHIVEFLEN